MSVLTSQRTLGSWSVVHLKRYQMVSYIVITGIHAP